MFNTPENIAKLKRPEGTLIFTFESEDLLDHLKHVEILRVISGKQFFLIEKDSSFNLIFYHSSPGTDTRKAEVNILELSKTTALKISITWSTTEIALYVGNARVKEPPIYTKGKPSQRKFRVTDDGNVFELNGASSVSVYVEGKPVLQTTAIESWHETIDSIKIFESFDIGNDFNKENIITNLTISMLTTGFETYCKRRFIEICDEGIQADEDGLIQMSYSESEIKNGIKSNLEAEAGKNGFHLTSYLVSIGRINFQNYNHSKKAYRKAYGLQFSNLGLNSEVIRRIKQYLAYRHKIIHISPKISLLNPEQVPPEEPVFAKKELALKAIDDFSNFVESLHTKSLKLRQ